MALPDRATIDGEYFCNESSGTNLPDTSDNSYDMTVSNAGLWAAGLIDNCLDFTAVANQYAETSGSSIFNYEYNDTFSYNYWAYDTYTGTAYSLIKYTANKGQLSGYTGFKSFFELRTNSTSLRLFVHTTNSAPSAQWNNHGWSYDGTNAASGVTGVLNGTDETLVVSQDNMGANTIQNSDSLSINGLNGVTGPNLKQDIIRFGNAEWSVAEHQSFYNSGAGVEEYPTGASDDHIKRYYYR